MAIPPGAPRSADGMWWWDGAAWQPAASMAPARRRGLPVLAWVGIGCAGIVGLVVVGLVVLGVTAFKSVHCPPSDFPLPPGVVAGNTNVHTGTGGNTCDSDWNATQSGDEVAAFYDARLRTGDWDIDSVDEASGVIRFHRRGRPGVQGEVELLVHGRETEIRLHMTAITPNFGR